MRARKTPKPTHRWSALLLPAIMLSAGLAATMAPLAVGQDTQDYLEDFEDDPLSPPSLPTEDFYDLTTSGSGTFRTIGDPALGNVAYLQNLTTGGASTFDFAPIDGLLCDQVSGTGGSGIQVDTPRAFSVFQVALYFDLIPQTGQFNFITWSNFRVQIFDGEFRTSIATTNTQETSTTTTVDSGFFPANKTWYNLTVSVDSCEEMGAGSCNGDTVQSTQQVSVHVVEPDVFWTHLKGGCNKTSNSDSLQFAVLGADRALVMDNLLLQDVTPPPVQVAATASAAVMDLRGAAVDPAGVSLIIRTNDSPDTIRRLDAQSLLETNSVATSNCNRVDGVSASTTHLAFLDCLGSPVNEYQIKVRSLNLTTPSFPSGCTWCNEDFTIAEEGPTVNNFDWDGDGVRMETDDFEAFDTNQIVNIRTPRFFIDNDFPDTGYGWMTWNFATADGRVGHAAFTAVENADEADRERRLAITQHSGAVDDICAASEGSITNPADPSTSREFLGAVAGGSSTKIYEVTYSQSSQQSLVGGYRVLIPTINEFFSNAVLNDAVGIACTNHKVVALTTDSAEGRNYTAPTGTLFSEPVTTAQSVGAAISGDGNFAVFMDGTTANVVELTNGTVVAEMEAPSGTFHSIHMDFVGANVWIATFDNVARYEVAEFTCEPNCDLTQGSGLSDDEDDPVDGGTTPGGDPIDTVFGGAAGKLAEAFGFDPNTETGATAGSLILALLLIAMLVALGIVGAVNLGGGVIMPVGAGILGFAGTWGMGLIPNVVAFVVLVIALALLSVRWFVR